MKPDYSFIFRPLSRRGRPILRTLGLIMFGAPALVLAQYSETSMLGGYNVSPTAAGNGGTFAGTASPGFQSASPMIYQPSTGWVGLPVGLGFVSSLFGIHLNSWGAASAISHNGSAVAGSTTGTIASGFQASYAAYWVNGVESLVPTPPDDPTTTDMTVTAISGDGTTLVVQDYNNVPTYGKVESYVYNIASGTFTSLGFFPGTTNQQTYATAINHDGTIVAGYYTLDTGDSHGFFWNVASGMTDIGLPASALGASFADEKPACISDDGTTLFGVLSIGNGWGGFRYNTTTGFQDLGDFSPAACTADGNEAVGTEGLLNYAAIWSPGSGSGTVANLLLANGITPSATGYAGPVSVSPDGTEMTAVSPNPISGEHYPTVTPYRITLAVPLKTAAVPPALLTFSTPYQETLTEPAGTLMQYADFNVAVTAVLVTRPHYASSFVLNADGSFSYTPRAGYISAGVDPENGTPDDSFTYKLTGPNGTSINASVRIAVDPPTVPTVDTPTAINVTATAATLGGIVESDGGAAITGVGVVYAPSLVDSNPQIGDGVASTAVGTGTTGAFAVNVGSLLPGTVYYYAAYASNTQGVSYSELGIFITYPLPTPGVVALLTAENTAASLPAAKLANVGTSGSGGALSITAVNPQSAQGGQVALAGGIITYTPPHGFVGPDSFTYTLFDGAGSAVGIDPITVMMQNPPAQNTLAVVPQGPNVFLEFLGIPGIVYVVQSSPNPGGPWADLSGPLTAGPTGLITYTATTIPSSQFYRTRVGP